jgi:tripartite-type tricarboxylate transporter receptor subunit TctC
MPPMLRCVHAALASASLVMLCATAQAQSWPGKPIRLIVPFAPGGSTDIVGRDVAARLAPVLGQQVVVDNRPGGSTIIGTELVARAAADGYTLLVTPAPFTINPTLQPKLPYDSQRDFTPITLINTTPLVIVVHPSVPVRTLQEFIRLARSRPGKLNFGSSGTGGSNHLAGELFNTLAGVKLVHVPYKGNAPALADLIGGHIDVVFNGLTSAIPQIRSGKLRALAVTSATRTAALPELPTAIEAGLPGFEATAWNGLIGPAALPREIVNRLAQEIARIVTSAEMRERFRNEGGDPVGSTPEQFARFLRDETEKWAKVIRLSGAKPEA